jgi:hypothetical protein
MALKTNRTDRGRKAHRVHAAQGRVDKRVKEILARRETALRQARRAAQRLKGSG